MGSPAAVEVIALKEDEYGKTPDLATAEAGTVRFISEALSGTPTTATSAELRKDRMSGGQVVVGLESGGTINFELSKDDMYDEFIEGALMSHWVTGVVGVEGAVTLTKDVTNDQLASINSTSIDTGDIDGLGRALAVGDVVVLTGFVNEANNGPVQVTEIVSASVFKATVQRETVDEVSGATGKIVVGDYVDIGSEINSWTLSKAYTDTLHLLTDEEHSQRYTGSIVNAMSLNVTYGEIINGVFTFLSNGYDQEHPSLHQQIDEAGGVVNPAGTANPLNGSVDMQMVTVDGQPTDFCIQSLTMELNNGSTPQTCIGKIAPVKYNLGPVAISITVSIYLSDQSYDKFMPAKLSQVPIGIMFATDNLDGGYAFDLRAVQLTFPDPAAAGGDTPVVIDASGVAKVGPNGSSAIRVWRW